MPPAFVRAVAVVTFLWCPTDANSFRRTKDVGLENLEKAITL